MARVQIFQGVLEGEVLDLVTDDGQYFSFKGIPYAKPPIGNLRFKAPVPPEPWNGALEAKKHGFSSPQFDGFRNKLVEGNEDCLYLNVYSPNIFTKESLPVMVWIHGGGFVFGSGDDFLYGADFLVRRGVVLVTLNYRLGALGFLSLDNKQVPGNAGMKDQVMALRWVKDNINKFGGDPDNVTIFGESAGGASVGFHVISPMSKGLFKRAILQSGSSTAPWAVSFQPSIKAIALGKKLGCETRDLTKLHEFLMGVPSSQLIALNLPTTLKEQGEVTKVVHWNIVDEKDFGQERFYYAGVWDAPNDVEVMAGYTLHEGILFVTDLEKQAEMIDRYFDYTVPCDIAWKNSLEKQMEIGRKITKHYFNDEPVTIANVKRIVDFYSFSQISYSIIQFLQYFKRKCKSPAYLYTFSCLSERNIMYLSILGSHKVACGMVGSSIAHADDLLYLFDVRIANLPLDKSSPSYEMILQTTKLWTNFAKYGNPTPDDSLGAVWSPYSHKKQEYLDIGHKLTPGTHPHKYDMDFWEAIYKEYLPEKSVTYL